ncbi:ATP-grasp domain-containing protein [Pseudobutyrivibrio sp. MD2005]|uniref:ATP-grasp domain-containing protein n=1 Tax=Pseudobutyrivibrio sp. MD2005 TaxID=1410616 RepID=UPI000482E886|nr:ATP-grasp domain-containing protein [Pseudobutyrivibrio sp. MD2005]
MKKIAIIGASYLQVPLINKAKEMGYETHVFAWEANDVGEALADYFYPISIIEKEQILQKCKEIKIDGICTIASDLATVAVNYVANEMSLVGNSMDCTIKSTNKWVMRETFLKNADPSPRFAIIKSEQDYNKIEFNYPVIVKPLDRSGSRGITKVDSALELETAVKMALEVGFEKSAIIEEFVSGTEYSIEGISYRGHHEILAITRKYTTGAPHFIETAHCEPAVLSVEIVKKIKDVVKHALTSLGVENGASHSELKIDKDGNIKIIEIGARMGGDCIGSGLVQLSTGVDFVKAVIDVAMGNKPDIHPSRKNYAIIRYVMNKKDKELMDSALEKMSENVIDYKLADNLEGEILDSSTRYGYFMMCDENGEVLKYLPEE